MTYLVDTDRNVDHLEERPAAVAVPGSRFNEGAGPGISLIANGTICEGIICNNRRSEQLKVAFIQLQRWIKVLPFDEAILRRFAGFRGSRRRPAQMIGDPDVPTTATALHFDPTLATRNLARFCRIDGLELFEPGT